MSTIDFNADLARQIHKLLAEHDERASDAGVAAHYLAATLGFWVGQLDENNADRGERLEQLFKMAVHVIHDVDQFKQNNDGVGTWKPNT
ncbi:MAG: hypothetical protein HWE20_02120 [Gammaproteobacteria bacterium]|nr:hypothetical protein [Gammaproteobacteria bacterium]